MRGIVPWGLALGLLVVAEADAHACSILQDDELPTNAALFFSPGCEDATVGVTIDGVPLALTWNPYSDLTDYPGFARIEADLRVGQYVLIEIDGELESLRVVDRDDEPPRAEAFEFEVSESDVFVSWMPLERFVHVATVFADGDVAEEDAEATTTPFPGASAFRLGYEGTLESACVEFMAVDPSGNTSTLDRCADATNGDGVPRGCACSSASEDPGGLWMAAFSFLLIARMRSGGRRGRRAARPRPGR